MSWMTPAPGATTPTSARLSVVIDRSRQARATVHSAVRAEQFLHPVPPLLHPGQRKPKVGDRVAHHVERRVAADEHEQFALLAHRTEAPAGQLGGQQVGPVLDLYRQYLTGLRERAH